MSAFNGLKFTQKGIDLQAKAQIGAELQYTRIGLGDGNYSGDILDIENLVRQVMSLPISSLSVNGGMARIGSALTNEDLATGFYLREIGVFAADPDEGEILYCYANAGAFAGYIPAAGGGDVIEKEVELITTVGSAENVTAVINESLVFATMLQVSNAVQVVQEALDEHAEDEDVHVTPAEKAEWNSKQDALGYTPEDSANKGQNNGYAGLDSNARIPIENIPDALLGQVSYQGAWNAATNTPELPDAEEVKGDYYVVSIAGEYQSITFEVGDWAISNGVEWQLVKNTDAVRTVAGKTGDVVLNKGDVGLGNVDNVQQAPLTHVGAGGTAHAAATTSTAGFMSAPDKTKLNGVATGAQVNRSIASQDQAEAGTDNTTDMTPLRVAQAIAALAPSAPVQSVNSKTGAVVITKGDVGLDSVDNVKQATKTEFDAHVNNTFSAHAASAISATGGTTVQAEIDAMKSGQAVVKLPDNSRNNASLPSDYPEGVSVMIANLNDDELHFPTGWGVVYTFINDFRASQVFYQNSGNLPGDHGSIYTRGNGAAENSWHPWRKVTDASGISLDSDDFTSDNVKGALEELFTSVSNGKSLVASAITDKGVPTEAADSFATMAANIEGISEAPTFNKYLSSVISNLEGDFTTNISFDIEFSGLERTPDISDTILFLQSTYGVIGTTGGTFGTLAYYQTPTFNSGSRVGIFMSPTITLQPVGFTPGPNALTLHINVTTSSTAIRLNSSSQFDLIINA